MVDPMGIAGMIFVLLIIAMVGGFILLLPLARRLGDYLDLRSKAGAGSIESGGEIRQLRESIQALQSEVQSIAERQEFTDSLLSESPEPRRLVGQQDAEGPM